MISRNSQQRDSCHVLAKSSLKRKESLQDVCRIRRTNEIQLGKKNYESVLKNILIEIKMVLGSDQNINYWKIINHKNIEIYFDVN